jgi:hypothetical protein
MKMIKSPWISRIKEHFNRHPFLWVCCFFLTVNFVTMPRVAYLGDPMTIRAAAIHLVKRGKIGIDPKQSPALHMFLGADGQYFFLNPKKNEYFSKWGVVPVLLFTPPVLVEDLLHGIPVDFSKPDGWNFPAIYSDPFIFILNIYNLILGALVLFYLWKLSTLYTRKTSVSIIFVIASCYTTFLWNFLRGQSLEIFQVLFFLGFFYHFAVFSRSQKNPDRAQWKHLLLAAIYCGLLTLLKPLYVIAFPWLWLFAALTVSRAGNTMEIIKRYWHEYLYFLVLPTLAAGFLAIGFNLYQFGSPFETGYSQINAASEIPHVYFSYKFLSQSVWGFLAHMRYSIFWHYPLALFALFGAVSFHKKHPLESALIWALFLSFFFCFASSSIWTGEWTYGPRYLVFILPVISLPFIDTLEILLVNRKKTWGCMGLGGILILLAWSAKLQMNVNSFPFLSHSSLQIEFNEFKNKEIESYFVNNHVGIFLGDFQSFRKKHRPFFPIEILKGELPPERQGFIPRMENYFRQNPAFQSNYFFFRETAPANAD